MVCNKGGGGAYVLHIFSCYTACCLLLSCVLAYLPRSGITGVLRSPLLPRRTVSILPNYASRCTIVWELCCAVHAFGKRVAESDADPTVAATKRAISCASQDRCESYRGKREILTLQGGRPVQGTAPTFPESVEGLSVAKGTGVVSPHTYRELHTMIERHGNHLKSRETDKLGRGCFGTPNTSSNTVSTAGALIEHQPDTALTAQCSLGVDQGHVQTLSDATI